MKRLLSALLISLVLVVCSGCGFPEDMKKVSHVVYTIEDAMVTAEPIVTLLEKEVPGWEGMPEAQQLKIINTCLSVESGTTKLSGIAQVIGSFIPAAKPITDGAVQILLLISTAAASIGAFIKNRKAKKVKAVAVAVMKAGDKTKDFGKKVIAEATAAEVETEARKIYTAEVKAK